MNSKRRNRKARCTLGDLVKALYDEVIEFPVSGAAKESLVAIMLGDIMRREGRAISYQARPRLKLHLDAA